MIIDNLIERSKAEGIYMINAGRAGVFDNKICGNNDGVICITSFANIRKNLIEFNKGNGTVSLLRNFRNLL